jgi:hypothetical protein
LDQCKSMLSSLPRPHTKEENDNTEISTVYTDLGGYSLLNNGNHSTELGRRVSNALISDTRNESDVDLPETGVVSAKNRIISESLNVKIPDNNVSLASSLITNVITFTTRDENKISSVATIPNVIDPNVLTYGRKDGIEDEV